MFFDNYLRNSFETFDVNASLLAMEMTAVMLFLKSRSDNTRQISMKHWSETEVFHVIPSQPTQLFPVYIACSRLQDSDVQDV